MIKLVNADAVSLPVGDGVVNLVVTSPPYWSLRDYGIAGQMGLEATPDEFIDKLVRVFQEVRRILHPSGVCFVNLGDSYASGTGGDRKEGAQGRQMKGRARKQCKTLKPKDLCLIPQRAAIALQADGWWVRSFMPWPKGNALPESVRDRPTTSHEYWIMLTKSKRYFWDGEGVRTRQKGDGRKRGCVHSVKRSEGTGRNDGGQVWQDTGTRNRRTSDTWNDGLDELIAHHRRYLAHLEQIRDGVGMMLDQDGEPAALKFNTAGYAGAHFATFPPKMIEPIIKAGASERGVCSVCRDPWVRVVERVTATPGQLPGYNQDCGARNDGERAGHWIDGKSTTTGWRPNCPHPNAPTIPALVCDPFVGSGTTLQVARALGRDALGFDLSFPYLSEQARTRLSLDALEAWENGRDGDGESLEDLPLFATTTS